MRRSLSLKIIATLLVTSLVAVGLVAFFASRAATSEFDRLRFEQVQADFVGTIQTYYQGNHDWTGLTAWLDTTNPPPPKPPDSSAYPMFALADSRGVIVKPGGPFALGDHAPSDAVSAGTPVSIGGQRVATLIFAGGPPELSGPERDYLARIAHAVFLGTLGAVGVALGVGVVMTRQILRPLSELTTAIRAMKQGQLEHRVPVRTRDELGETVAAFNEMSGEMHRVNQLRRQMTADIAHELRTPLTVIIGYLQGLRDGTLRPTPERLDTLYGEAEQLARLVEDLRTLTLADAGELALRREPEDIADILRHVAAAFEGAAEAGGVSLAVSAQADLPDVSVDRERMTQVLANLLRNALRYTSSGGQINLSARQERGGLLVRVADTGSGIPAERLAHVFERFYRVEELRAGSDGESGLGLAIVKSIVEAHGGTVAAESQVGQGTTILIQLPLAHP